MNWKTNMFNGRLKTWTELEKQGMTVDYVIVQKNEIDYYIPNGNKYNIAYLPQTLEIFPEHLEIYSYHKPNQKGYKTRSRMIKIIWNEHTMVTTQSILNGRLDFTALHKDTPWRDLPFYVCEHDDVQYIHNTYQEAYQNALYVLKHYAFNPACKPLYVKNLRNKLCGASNDK